MINSQLSTLLVENNPETSASLKNILTGQGIKVDQTDDEQSALEKSTIIPYDVIIIDVDQPEIDSIKLLGDLRENDVSKYIPIILLGSKTNFESIPAGIRNAGAIDYLSMPVDQNRFLARIEIMGRISQMQKELLLTERIREVQEMSRSTFHALSQPLMAISGQAQLLAMNIEDENLKKRCQTIVDAVEEISKKINELRAHRKTLLGY
jgi:PleD family two-component response regulator